MLLEIFNKICQHFEIAKYWHSLLLYSLIELFIKGYFFIKKKHCLCEFIVFSKNYIEL